LVEACQELPGQHLFQYVDERDTVSALTSTQVNEYLRTITGCDFTAKDFRTWGGTVTATRLLHQVGPGDTPKDSERNIVQVIKQVAEKLGNTPAVCRQHYVHPAILTAYADGQLATLYANVAKAHKKASPALAEDEAVVYAILRKSAK
jgi:DNA topoisomerase-1